MPHSGVRHPREVSRTQLDCGELLQVQTYTGTADPYMVWLFYRPNGKSDWIQYKIDDESPFWWGPGLTGQGKSAILTFYWWWQVGAFTCADEPDFVVRGWKIGPYRTTSNPFDPKNTY